MTDFETRRNTKADQIFVQTAVSSPANSIFTEEQKHQGASSPFWKSFHKAMNDFNERLLNEAAKLFHQ